MTIVGFAFTKISAERVKPIDGPVSINNNISVKEIQRQEINMGQKKTQPALKFVFEFVSDYDPKVGSILLEGEITYIADEKVIEAIVKDWKAKKVIEKDLMSIIINNALARCNIQALVMSRDVNLPPPIPLPKLQVEEK